MIRDLLSDAPPLAAICNLTEPAAQARAILRYVSDRLETAASGTRLEEDSNRCPNCGSLAESARSPYCSETCREVAGFVRQFRTGVKEGWLREPDKQVALGQVLWHILGGGRPLRRSLVPAGSVERVIAREGGRCEACSATATTVDHAGSGCNRTINLRAVCEACCRDRPFGDSEVAGAAGFEALLDELAARIGSSHPLRVCDDAATWDWRAFLKGRSAIHHSS